MRCFAPSLVFSALVLAFVAAPAAAEEICVVNDPTGTPLNVRATPNGNVIGTLGNGRRVNLVDVDLDSRGREWALVRQPVTDAAIGWVFRAFVACPR